MTDKSKLTIEPQAIKALDVTDRYNTGEAIRITPSSVHGGGLNVFFQRGSYSQGSVCIDPETATEMIRLLAPLVGLRTITADI